MSQTNLQTLSWPANSPDLNPIEPGWNILKRSTWSLWYANRSQSVEQPGSGDLKNMVMAAWEAIEPGYLRSLVESMSRRVELVIAAKGGHIKY